MIWFYRFPFYTHYLSHTLHAHDHFWHVLISVLSSYIICPKHYIACQRNSITIFIICRKHYTAWRGISYHKHTEKNVKIMFNLWIIWACISNSSIMWRYSLYLIYLKMLSLSMKEIRENEYNDMSYILFIFLLRLTIHVTEYINLWYER